jgi:hypothetical protein
MTFIITPMNRGVYMASILILLVFAVYVSILFLFSRDWENQAECLFHRILGLIILIIVVYLSAHRDTFLPFIGETVFPYTLIKDATITRGNVTKTIAVNEPNGTKVAYWAAMPDNKVDSNPQIAYDNYANVGIAIVNEGQAALNVNCPAQYKVPPFNKTLERHIHYRIIYKNGMVSEVHTVKVKC